MGLGWLAGEAQEGGEVLAIARKSVYQRSKAKDGVPSVTAGLRLMDAANKVQAAAGGRNLEFLRFRAKTDHVILTPTEPIMF